MNMLFKERNTKHLCCTRYCMCRSLFAICFRSEQLLLKATLKFGHSKFWIRDAEGRLKGMGSLEGKLYRLDC